MPKPTKSTEPPKTPEPPNVLVFTDIGNDYDDLMALLILGHLHKEGKIKLKGVIATYNPATKRAQQAKALVKWMGIPSVPVAAGTAGTDDIREPSGHEFDKDIEAPESELEKDYTKLFENVLKEAKKAGEKIRLLSLASLRDLWHLTNTHKQLFLEVVSEVHIQGLCSVENGKLVANDKADIRGGVNMNFDLKAAQQFYSFIAEHNIACTTYTKAAALKSVFQQDAFDGSTGPMKPVGDYLLHVHKAMNETYYNDAIDTNRNFQNRDLDWFVQTRTGMSKDAKEFESFDAKGFKRVASFPKVLPYIRVVPYDPIAALGCVREAVGDVVQKELVPGLEGKGNRKQYLVGDNVDGEKIASVIQGYLKKALLVP